MEYQQLKSKAPIGIIIWRKIHAGCQKKIAWSLLQQAWFKSSLGSHECKNMQIAEKKSGLGYFLILIFSLKGYEESNKQ